MHTFLNTFLEKKELLWELLIDHIQLTFIALLMSIFIGVGLGILITRHQKLAKLVIGIANVVQAIPSLAILGFLIPLIGIGRKPAIVMAIIYALLPIIKNTYTAIINIDQGMIEVARGIGLTPRQILTKIKMPLAIPVMMAGIRIAAVTTVGLMTIAAFVGGGGLGYLVFSGIQTINSDLILLGAIPTALLALIIDCVIGMIEEGLTPQGIKLEINKGMIKRRWVISIIIIGIGLLTGQMINAMAESKETIRIGSKLDTESTILGAMLCELVEDKTDLKVERKLRLGNTQILSEAIAKGEIDVCVDYTGTMLMSILGEENIYQTPEALYDYVKATFDERLGLQVLQPFGMNNTYAIGIRQDTKEKYGIETLKDLQKANTELIAGTTIEFANRPDGLTGLQTYYDLAFEAIKPVDGTLRYTAITNYETDLIDVYVTDALIKQFDLYVLEDTENFFPPYYGVPVIRNEIANKYKDLTTCLDTLAGILTNDVIRELNYKVDIEKQDPEQVAYDFLLENGYIK